MIWSHGFPQSRFSFVTPQLPPSLNIYKLTDGDIYPRAWDFCMSVRGVGALAALEKSCIEAPLARPMYEGGIYASVDNGARYEALNKR